MRNIIQNSSLYESKQKKSLLKKLDEQNEILEKLLRGEDDEEYTNEDEDVPLNDDEEIDGDENIPLNDEKIDYYKEW